jgi:hypothetical protein
MKVKKQNKLKKLIFYKWNTPLRVKVNTNVYDNKNKRKLELIKTF